MFACVGFFKFVDVDLNSVISDLCFGRVNTRDPSPPFSRKTGEIGQLEQRALKEENTLRISTKKQINNPHLAGGENTTKTVLPF